jgi:hypothetical protein
MRDIVIQNNSRIGAHIWGSVAESRDGTEDFYEAGIRWIRSTRPMEMDDVLVGPYAYDFNHNGCEDASNRQFEAGFNIMGILDFEHYKAQPLCSPIWEHLAEWEAFVRACVLHYKDRVKYWEVINEPPYGWLMPKPADAPADYWERGPISEYAKLLKLTAGVIRELDPEAVVLCGSTMYDGKFLRLFYENDCKDAFDIATVHYLHCSHPQQYHREYDLLRGIMAEYGDADKPLWDTECGPGGERADKYVRTHVGYIEYQACSNVYRHCLAHATGLPRYFWFNPNWDWDHTGKDYVPTRDERGALTPPYQALKVMTDTLGTSELATHRSLGDEVHAYVFATPRGPVSVLWATEPSPLRTSISLDVIDMLGNPISLGREWTQEHIPVYIEADVLSDQYGLELRDA